MPDEALAVDVSLDTNVGADTGSDLGSDSTALTVQDHSTDVATVDDDQQAVEPFRALENGRPSKAMQAGLQALKTTHPELAKQIPGAFAVQHRLRAEFPGQNPWNGIASLKSFAREVAAVAGNGASPRQALAEIQRQLTEIEEMDLLYAGGDPRMLDAMTKLPEGQASFVKLMPHAFARYEKLAPKAYSKYMGQVIRTELVGSMVDMAVQRIAALTPKEIVAADGTKTPNPIIAELTKVQQWFARIDGLADAAVDLPDAGKPDPRSEELDRRERELQQSQRKQELQGWGAQATGILSQVFQYTWNNQTKGLKISDIDREDIQGRIRSEVNRRLRAAQASIQPYIDNNDRQGYITYMRSLYNKNIPEVTRNEIKRRVKPVAGTKEAAATTTTTTRAQPAEAGFRRIAAAPTANDVKMGPQYTTAQMWAQKKAVLREGNTMGLPGGTKVQWG